MVDIFPVASKLKPRGWEKVRERENDREFMKENDRSA